MNTNCATNLKVEASHFPLCVPSIGTANQPPQKLFEISSPPRQWFRRVPIQDAFRAW